jgi:hypothetical protein
MDPLNRRDFLKVAAASEVAVGASQEIPVGAEQGSATPPVSKISDVAVIGAGAFATGTVMRS